MTDYECFRELRQQVRTAVESLNANFLGRDSALSLEEYLEKMNQIYVGYLNAIRIAEKEASL